MFAIKGEGLFVGDMYIADGMKMSDDLRANGFSVTQNNCCFDSDVKRWGFVFECGPTDLIPKERP